MDPFFVSTGIISPLDFQTLEQIIPDVSYFGMGPWGLMQGTKGYPLPKFKIIHRLSAVQG